MFKINLSFAAPLSVFIFAVFAGFITYRAGWFNIDKHFSLLAQSFINGDLFLSPNNLPNGDFVDVEPSRPISDKARKNCKDKNRKRGGKRKIDFEHKLNDLLYNNFKLP